jgi:adenylate kinase family enzyme
MPRRGAAGLYRDGVRRILVYGVTGSGKSTLARRIGERLGLPYHAIDDLTWEPGWVPVSDDVQRERVRAVCAGEAWVIDAAYGRWAEIPLARVELIVALDFPRWLSLGRLLRRSVVHIVRRTPTCNGNVETWRNTFFDRKSILVWHFRSFKRKQRRIRAWQADPGFPEVVRMRRPADVERWLAALPERT